MTLTACLLLVAILTSRRTVRRTLPSESLGVTALVGIVLVALFMLGKLD